MTLSSKDTHKKWWGIVAALAVVVITSIPQLNLCIKRGSNWHGSYAILDYDELTYSAYLNSLIRGQGRTTNPFTGSPGSENYYSIQFLPPYLIAFSSRLLNISASTTFISLAPIMAFLASLSIFWLFTETTNDSRVAAFGVLIVLLCGRLVSESPLSPNQEYATFAFLRRYIPAIPFPLFFVFCVCVWRALTSKRPGAYFWSCAAGVVFGGLTFSYFYLWTAALTWAICITLLWLLTRPEQRLQTIKSGLLFILPASLALIPYFYLVSKRARTIDTSQAFHMTHVPELLHVVEIVGILLLFALLWLVKRGRAALRSPSWLFAASFAVVPLIVFNQQLFTGRSLQPFHYEQFVINYVVLIAAVLTYNLLWPRPRIRPVIWILFALTIGVVSALKEASDNFQLNVRYDEAKPTFERIDELAKSGLGGLALFNNSLLAASAPTTSSIGELWSPNMYTYGNISADENLERLYQYFYFLGVDSKGFKETLENSAQTQAAVFGLSRANPKLESKFRPVTSNEIEEQVKRYSEYTDRFSSAEAAQWPLSFVVIMDDSRVDFSRLDRWYIRDGSQHVGGTFIHLVRLRQ